MTTAHRPTWKAAVARDDARISTSQSLLNAPAHTKLKHRASYDRRQALAQSLQALQQAEPDAQEEQSRLKLLKHTTDVDDEKLKQKYDDSDVEGDSDAASSHLDSSDSSDEDDDDDEAALQAELAKIRAERAAAQAQKEAEQAAQEEEEQEEAALLGNPLLQEPSNKRRRWNDDVVFRNQAKDEPKAKKRFINDTVRNDFHKRFLNKFIR